MRIRFTALVVALAVPLVAQQEPLPAVTPLPLIALAVEPEPASIPAPTLASAARANDFATFDALFRTTRAEEYRPLHELWTYSVTDPIGAFYGADMYERFARAYPRFAEYIADYRIVDSRGNVFYPSSETRAFLLTQAERGAVVAPEPVVVAAVEERVVPETKSAPVPDGLRARRSTSTTAIAIPVAIVAAAVPVTVAPVAPPVVAPVPAPVVVAPAPLVSSTAPAKQNQNSGRGLLLVILGLIGTGVLALIVRTPAEVPSIRNP